jgi:hypothetical protein
LGVGLIQEVCPGFFHNGVVSILPCHPRSLFNINLLLFMTLAHQDDDYGNAPEVCSQHHAHLFPVHDQSPPYTVLHPEGHCMQTAPVNNGNRWTRWWVLALIGVLIALIAGILGGFIGKAILEAQGALKKSPGVAPSGTTTTASLPNCTNTAPSATVSLPSQASGTLGTITIPSTGCNFPASKERRSIPKITDYTNTAYTTICNSGWIGAGLAGIWTLSPSDCMESCVRYNLYRNEAAWNQSAPTCVGGGFIPDWTNRTRAVSAERVAPFNCYLAYNSRGIIRNDREQAGVEVVALCLDGMCDSVGS